MSRYGTITIEALRGAEPADAATTYALTEKGHAALGSAGKSEAAVGAARSVVATQTASGSTEYIAFHQDGAGAGAGDGAGS